MERMRAWTAKGLRSFLEGRDLVGPAGHLFAQGMNGADFLELSESDLIDKVKTTPFLAKKLVQVRELVVNLSIGCMV